MTPIPAKVLSTKIDLGIIVKSWHRQHCVNGEELVMGFHYCRSENAVRKCIMYKSCMQKYNDMSSTKNCCVIK